MDPPPPPLHPHHHYHQYHQRQPPEETVACRNIITHFSGLQSANGCLADRKKEDCQLSSLLRNLNTQLPCLDPNKRKLRRRSPAAVVTFRSTLPLHVVLRTHLASPGVMRKCLSVRIPTEIRHSSAKWLFSFSKTHTHEGHRYFSAFHFCLLFFLWQPRAKSQKLGNLSRERKFICIFFCLLFYKVQLPLCWLKSVGVGHIVPSEPLSDVGAALCRAK